MKLVQLVVIALAANLVLVVVGGTLLYIWLG